MLSKNRIKHLQSLRLKKNRSLYKEFIAEGEKIVVEILQSSIPVKQLYAHNQWLQAHANLISKATEIVEITESELKKISNLHTPNEVLALCAIPQYELCIENIRNKLSIVLDNIQDPGNLGTIIRLADWFGIETLICSEECADCFNSKVVQATMGSIARVQLHYIPLKDFLTSYSQKNNAPIYGALLNGSNIYEQRLSTNGLIVMGNESQGISKEVISFITHPLLIPSFNQHQKTDSLNVATATAIICSEFKRSK